MSEINRPKVGVAVIIIRDNQVLMGKRLGAHGSHTWNFPGGHLEYGESIEVCGKREVLEETGLIVRNIKLGPYTNDIFDTEGKHYITLFTLATNPIGEPQIMEPDKCTQWSWFSWDDLPQPLFLPIQNLLKQGFKPSFD